MLLLWGNNMVRCAFLCLLAVTVLTLPVPASAGARRYALDGWVLTVREDAFSGERRCDLRGRDGTMLYQPGAVGLKTGDRDTLDALYRIDGGPALHWRDRYPVLFATGVVVEGSGLADPTDRIVWLPEAELHGAQTVMVRAHPGARPRTFRLGGIDTAIAAAARMRCPIVRTDGR